MKISRWMAWLFSLALLGWGMGPALAQSEPTLDQIYQAANSGRMNEARSMTEQVLKNHPKSAKAHYVKAELAARQGDAAVARQELDTAERIAPGLPFAKPESVRALKTQVARLSSGSAAPPTDVRQVGGPAAPAPAAPSLPWGKLLLGAGVLLAILAFLRRRPSAPSAYGGGAGPYGNGSPMAGSGYGPGPGTAPGTAPYPYGTPGAAPSMGSTLGRGLATGLAIGAGAVAAQEIGRRMFDHNGNPVAPDAPHAGQAGNFGLSDPSSMDNPDMGGQDFGINDGGSWDDGGGADDWDT
jgi:uncharacterized protein